MLTRTALLLAALLPLAGLVAGCTPDEPAPGAAAAARADRVAADEAPLFDHQLLVYGFHGFTADEVARIRRTVKGDVTAVGVGEVEVASGRPSYPVIPVETMTADPGAYAAAAARPALAAALRKGAVLSQTEAKLRKLGVGGTLRLTDGRHFPVTAIVDDHELGGNEMALPASAVPLRKGEAASYLLIDHRGDPTAVSRQVRAALPARKLRAETHTANGYLSSDDTVLTQAQLKARFGEFALRHLPDGRGFAQDPHWQKQWLRTVRHVPQLGGITCNKAVLPALTAAMKEITAKGLGHTISTADFQYEGGCWNPAVVPLTGGSISRHAWAIAVDLNVYNNQLGSRSHQDRRLVAIMHKHGFSWGGDWLRSDPMHFEYVGRPG